MFAVPYDIVQPSEYSLPPLFARDLAQRQAELGKLTIARDMDGVTDYLHMMDTDETLLEASTLIALSLRQRGHDLKFAGPATQVSNDNRSEVGVYYARSETDFMRLFQNSGRYILDERTLSDPETSDETRRVSVLYEVAAMASGSATIPLSELQIAPSDADEREVEMQQALYQSLERRAKMAGVLKSHLAYPNLTYVAPAHIDDYETARASGTRPLDASELHSLMETVVDHVLEHIKTAG